MKKRPNCFCVIGLGYVGLTLATLLAKSFEVIGIDNNNAKIKELQKGISPLKEPSIQKELNQVKYYINFTNSIKKIKKKVDYFLIALPSNFDKINNKLNVDLISKIIEGIHGLYDSPKILIKSTVPIGFTSELQLKHNNQNIIFSPEFLREGKSIHDSYYPDRIIIGGKSKVSKDFGKILCGITKSNKPHTYYVNSSEAEAIKLFSNSYLAMRVAFFNELDNFAINNKLNTHDLIKGISADKRIGNYYNNPSLGYGGYCLPKDTSQLESQFGKNQQKLITAITNSNKIRKEFLGNDILKINCETIGIYKINMKKNSDNNRKSAIFDIIKKIRKKRKVFVYDPHLSVKKIKSVEIIKNFKNFVEKSDLILTNRLDDKILPFSKKIYTRDIFNEN